MYKLDLSFLNFIAINYLISLFLFTLYISLVWRKDRLMVTYNVHKWIIFFFYLSLSGVPIISIFFIKLHILNSVIATYNVVVLLFFIIVNTYSMYFYYYNYSYFINLKIDSSNELQNYHYENNFYNFMLLLIIYIICSTSIIFYFILYI